MLHRKELVAKGRRSRRGRCFGIRWGLGCVCMAAMMQVSGIAQGQNAAATQRTAHMTVPAPVGDAQNVTVQAGQHDKKLGHKNPSPAVVERQKQLADDSAKLLALALALKTEVDKTNQNTLSIGVIRRAEEIEKLAHNVRDKLKQNDGGI